MKIYNQQGTEIYDIAVDDSSVRYRSIMNDDSLTLSFSLTESIEIPRYSYVDFEGSRYTLWRPEEFKKNGSRNHEYTLTLYGYREFLKFVKFKDTSSKPYRLKFFLTGNPRDFMTMLVNSLNDKDSGWTIGDCIDATEKTLSFNHEYCIDMLARLASEFNTEYEFEGKKIHLRKVEKFKGDPLALSYGKGNGFLPGVGRYNDGDTQPIGRLYVQGGERNIDYSSYGSKTLLLPKSATLTYNGKTYRTDADGMYISRDGNNNAAEESFDASEIYPQRVGTVTAVEVIDAEKNFYDIIDTTIPEALDYSNCRIAGEKATIVFQSGALAGREFDIEQTENELTGYVHAERRFKIVPAELDGIVMPGGVFVPAVGDKYAIFNISLPQAYIQNDSDQSGASWDMMREAVKYFAENEEDKFKFIGELNGIWSKSRWLEIGGKIVPGAYILFSDTQFQPQGVLIRIVAVKDYVNKPHKPEITLSNGAIAGSFSAEIGKLNADEVVIEESKKEAIRYSKRQWRDARETMEMLQESLLNFSGSINPITIQTMQLLVGDESLQFRFVNNKTNPVAVDHAFTFNKNTDIFSTAAGIIQHMTIGISALSITHKASEYKFWDMYAYTSPALDASKAYFLYAKCSKSGTTGTFLLSETSIKMEQVSEYYHLLVGILNSEQDGDRSFAPLYGFSEILPGRITTDKIISSDGKTYFDLLNGIIGGNIKFISTAGDEQDMGEWAENTENSIEVAKQEATAAAQAYADAQASLAETQAKAYADGVVSEEEQRAINDAQAKLDAAKAYADAQDNLVKTEQKAYADGVADEAEQAAISEAQAYAELKKTEAQAYADGIVDAEEQRAIADATAKFNEAKTHAETLVDNLEIGGRNLLLGSAFNDLSKFEVGVNVSIDTSNKILGNNSVKSIQSGLANDYCIGVWSSNIAVNNGEKFTLTVHSYTDNLSSFDNSAFCEVIPFDSAGNRLFPSVIALDIKPTQNGKWEKKTISGKVQNANVSYIRITLYVTKNGRLWFGGIKFEKGYKATDWTPAPEDVQAEIDTAQSAANEALAKANSTKAITDKFGTTVNGGLINTVTMELREAGTQDVTAFISGLRGDGTLPAFGAGGTYDKALAVVSFMQKMMNGVTPSQKEYDNLAKVAITHNGASKLGAFFVLDDGQIVMADPATGKIRLVFSPYTIPLIADLMSQNTAGDSATNSSDVSEVSGTFILPNTVSVTKNGSELTASGSLYIDAYLNFPKYETGLVDVSISLFKDGVEYLTIISDARTLDKDNLSNYMVTTAFSKKYTVPAGTYAIGINRQFYSCISLSEAGLTGNSTLSWTFSQARVKYFNFGLDGMMAFYTNNHFHFTENGGLDVRGATNIPGVLLAGEVGLNGGFSSIWGAKKHATNTATRHAIGQYTVYHSIGHTDYQVQVTPTSANRTCYIVSKSTDNFVVYSYSVASSPVLANTGFNFSITGSNY